MFSRAAIRLIARWGLLGSLVMHGGLDCGESAAQVAAEAAHSEDELDGLYARRNRAWDAAQEHAFAGAIADAVTDGDEALAIHSSIPDASPADTAMLCGWLGEQRLALGDFAAAESLFLRQQDALTSLADVRPWRLADARRAAADAHHKANLNHESAKKLAEALRLDEQALDLVGEGDHAAALAAIQQALQLRRELFGDEHAEVVESLLKMASLFELNGELEKATKSYAEAAAMALRLYDDHPKTADALSILADAYGATGDFERARFAREQVLAIRRRVLGDHDDSTVLAMDELAQAYVDAQLPRRARPLLEEALSAHAESKGRDHPHTISALRSLAQFHASLGQFANARPLYEEVLATRRRAAAEDPPAMIEALRDMAQMHHLASEYSAAAELLEQAREIAVRRLDPEHAATGALLGDLADAYAARGDFGRALPLAEQALATCRKRLGNDHTVTLMQINRLARVQQSIGSVEQARALYEEALQTFGGTLQVHDDPALAATLLINASSLYQQHGRHEEALALAEKASAIVRKYLGDEHPALATCTNGVAMACMNLQQYDRARELLEESLAVKSQALGASHPSTAGVLNNLAEIAIWQGDHERADRLFAQARDALENSLGIDHPETSSLLNNIAAAKAATGDWTAVRDLLVQSSDRQLAFLERQVFLLDSGQIASLVAESAAASNVLIAAADHGASSDEAIEALLNRAGLVYEVLLRRRAAESLLSSDDDAARDRAELQRVQQELLRLAMRPPRELAREELAARRQRLRLHCDQLLQRLNGKLAAALGPRHTELGASLATLRRALAPDSTFINFVRLRRHRFHATRGPSWEAARYYAIVVPQQASKQAAVIDLGPAEDIDDLIGQVSRQMRDFGRVGRHADESDLETQYREIAAQLYQKVFAPLHEALGASRRIHLACDGLLHDVPFETLVDEQDHFLIEKDFQFAYVNSVRDLVRPPPGATGDGVFVFAGPNYNLGHEDRAKLATSLAPAPAFGLASSAPGREQPPAALDAARQDNGTRLGWQHLPGADLEGEEAAAAFANGRFGPVSIRTCNEALEGFFKRVRQPRVLVVVTHGDFLEALPSASPAAATSYAQPQLSVSGLARRDLPAMDDPMLRSYLVFAGANKLADLPADTALDDGWLTAAEIARLDLLGTELVVLSACNTNRGEADNSQAVLGMRAAFLFAGARTIVGSLYEVPNTQTRDLMGPFYQGVAAGQGKLAALNAAKLEFIRQRRATEAGAAHPFYWASFVLVGEP